MQLTGTEFLIGRKEACHLRYVGDNLISSVHARLFVRSNGTSDEVPHASPALPTLLSAPPT